MRLNLKKVSAIAASTLMVGMTMGFAAAAQNYPAPFVQGGAANVAIVYGTGDGVSDLDQVQSYNVNLDLQSYMEGSSSSGASASGESIKFEKEGIDKLNIGNNLTEIISIAIDEDDMPTILAEGTYSNADSEDFDYEQKIELDNDIRFGLFADTDYMDKDPTIGLRIPKKNLVANYTLDFVKSAEDDTNSGDDFNDYEDTTITILGKTYDITTAVNTSGVTKLTFMGGASKDTLNLNEKKTYTVDSNSYDVELTYVDSSDYCRFTINGETTDKILKGGTDKLSDGTYVGVADVDYSTGAVTEIMRCKFYLGADKMVLEDKQEVEINDVDVDELRVYWDETDGNPFKLNKMILEWKAEDDLFITEGSEVAMPGFGSVKLTSGGFTTVSEYEHIKIRGASNEDIELTMPIKSGDATIKLLASNTTGGWMYVGGYDDGERLVTNNGSSAEINITYNLSTSGNGTEYFVATYFDGSKTGSSYLVEITDADGTDGVDFKDAISGTAIASNIRNDTSFEIGDATFVVDEFVDDAYVLINISASSNSYFDRIVTKKGLMIYLPVDADDVVAPPFINLTNGSASGLGDDGAEIYTLWMEEEDKDGSLTLGDDINVSLKFTAAANDYNAEVKFNSSQDNVCSYLGSATGAALEDADDDNSYICYIESDLGTKVIYDSDPDEDTVDIYYPGEQTYGNIFLSEVSSVVSSAGVTGGAAQIGNIVVKDSEIDNVQGKNLIVVGGSCINSVAANLLGSAACSTDFTDLTGIGSGQFLIQSFGDAYTTGKIALLVAGYSVDDTVNAVTYLTTKTVDTTADKKYKGTSATTAELVTEETSE